MRLPLLVKLLVGRLPRLLPIGWLLSRLPFAGPANRLFRFRLSSSKLLVRLSNRRRSPSVSSGTLKSSFVNMMKLFSCLLVSALSASEAADFGFASASEGVEQPFAVIQELGSCSNGELR